MLKMGLKLHILKQMILTETMYDIAKSRITPEEVAMPI